jgi:hypothetical protein
MSDYLIVSAAISARIDDSAITPEIAARLRVDLPDGRKYIDFAQISVEPKDGEERQTLLEEIWFKFRAAVASAGIDSDKIVEWRATTFVHVSLAPESSQSGLAFTNEMLSAWDGMALDLNVSFSD